MPKSKPPVDRAKPGTWVKFKTGLCESCWASCCHDMPLQVSVSDLCRLELTTEKAVASNLPAEISRLKKARVLKQDQPEEFIYILEQQPNKDCIYLGSDRTCTVYHRRPEICRRFPRLSPNPGHCPYLQK